MLRDSTVIVVVRTRPRAIPLPMITLRKSIHGFPFRYMVMGLRLAFGPPELRYKDRNKNTGTVKSRVKEHVFWGFRPILFLYIESFLQNQPECVLNYF